MDKNRYDKAVQEWMEKVQKNCMKDTELTLKYCNDIIGQGLKIKDDSLIAFGYYYCGVVYYVLNDGNRFFEAVTNALSYLSKAEEWEMMARCYNFLGITAMNRGNAVIGADYYMNAIECSKKAQNEALAAIISVNIGALNTMCGRYKEAIDVLIPVYEYFSEHKSSELDSGYMLPIYQNLSKAYMCCGKLEEAKKCFDNIHREYKMSDENYVEVAILCAEAMYYHIMGDDENCEKLIARIHKATNQNIPIMDMFDDYYDYCKILLCRDKSQEFWHIVNIMESMIKSLDFVNLQMKLVGLKIKYYRQYGQNAEYLQATGLYYELSEHLEAEIRVMMKNVFNLRKSLEKVKRENEQMEEENKRLLIKSETDPLTNVGNRFRLNDVSEEMFRQCLQNGISLTVEILDVDDFKGYNDTNGHQSGDECLVKVAQALNTMQKEHGAFVARYGGDEFILIYQGITREEAVSYAEELKQKVMDLQIPFAKSPVADVVTITQGLCWDIPVSGNRMWDYLHSADNMLYRVKQKQRNNYCVGNLKETEEHIIMSC